jgi:hypothetical protein
MDGKGFFMGTQEPRDNFLILETFGCTIFTCLDPLTLLVDPWACKRRIQSYRFSSFLFWEGDPPLPAPSTGGSPLNEWTYGQLSIIMNIVSKFNDTIEITADKRTPYFNLVYYTLTQGSQIWSNSLGRTDLWSNSFIYDVFCNLIELQWVLLTGCRLTKCDAGCRQKLPDLCSTRHCRQRSSSCWWRQIFWTFRR